MVSAFLSRAKVECKRISNEWAQFHSAPILKPRRGGGGCEEASGGLNDRNILNAYFSTRSASSSTGLYLVAPPWRRGPARKLPLLSLASSSLSLIETFFAGSRKTFI